MSAMTSATMARVLKPSWRLPKLDGEQGQPAHQSRPHHRSPGSYQQGVDGDARQGGDAPAPASPAAG